MVPARRVGRVAGDPGQAQGQAVRERHVPVQPLHEHRMVRRDGVDRAGAWAAPCDGHASWSQLPSWIQVPLGSVRACAPSRRASSASSRASRRSTDRRPKPPLRKCTWASLKPGHHQPAARGRRRAYSAPTRAPARRRRPPATTRSPRTAMAVAFGTALAHPHAAAAEDEVGAGVAAGAVRRARAIVKSARDRRTHATFRMTIVMSSCCAASPTKSRIPARMRSFSSPRRRGSRLRSISVAQPASRRTAPRGRSWPRTGRR